MGERLITVLRESEEVDQRRIPWPATVRREGGRRWKESDMNGDGWGKAYAQLVDSRSVRTSPPLPPCNCHPSKTTASILIEVLCVVGSSKTVCFACVPFMGLAARRQACVHFCCLHRASKRDWAGSFYVWLSRTNGCRWGQVISHVLQFHLLVPPPPQLLPLVGKDPLAETWLLPSVGVHFAISVHRLRFQSTEIVLMEAENRLRSFVVTSALVKEPELVLANPKLSITSRIIAKVLFRRIKRQYANTEAQEIAKHTLQSEPWWLHSSVCHLGSPNALHWCMGCMTNTEQNLVEDYICFSRCHECSCWHVFIAIILHLTAMASDQSEKPQRKPNRNGLSRTRPWSAMLKQHVKRFAKAFQRLPRPLCAVKWEVPSLRPHDKTLTVQFVRNKSVFTNVAPLCIVYVVTLAT